VRFPRRAAAAPAAALALATAFASAGCTAHAPCRTEASAVVTSSERLATPQGRAAAEHHSIEVHPDFTLAFVELDDQGRFWDRAQLVAMERMLEAEAARTDQGGVIVGVFAHGWMHDASVCDSNVACYRTFLRQVAQDVESIRRVSGGSVTSRRVVGIYVGWRGRSGDIPGARALTFWARKRVAHSSSLTFGPGAKRKSQ